MKKIYFLVLAACALVACNESSKDLQISPSSVNLYYEETQQVKVLSESGSFDWSTANDFHATVNSNGVITAGHVGSTVITASQGKKKGAQLPLSPSTIYMTRLTLVGENQCRKFRVNLEHRHKFKTKYLFMF